MKKRDSVPYCTVHNKFQTQNGRWLDASEDLGEHLTFNGLTRDSLMESPCDECDDPKQIEIEFEDGSI